MTYATYDLSVDSGSPLELYRFVYNDTVYRYCTLDGGVPFFTLNGEIYYAASLDHPNYEQSEDIQKTTQDLKVRSNLPVAELFFLGPPEGVISVTIMRLHLTDADFNYVVSYKGRVTNCSFDGDDATLHCEPIFSSLRRPGLRMVYETQCVHGLFQQGCNLIRDDWKVLGSVLDVDGLSVVVQQAADKPDGWFKGGTIVIGDVRRMIMDHVGVTLTVMHAVRTDVIGKDCILYPGCDHTLTMCAIKYNNAVNGMIFAWLPQTNPFTNNIIW
jgi:hypothetical protein